MQRDRFALLRFVPDENAVREIPKQRLAGEIVPAPDAEAGRDAEALRGGDVIELARRHDADERCDEQHIGALRPQVLRDGLAWGRGALQLAECQSDQRTSRGCLHPWKIQEPQQADGHAIFGSHP
jgi:hypothetical protein